MESSRRREEDAIDDEKRRHAQAAAWARRTGRSAPPPPQPKLISQAKKHGQEILIVFIPEGCESGEVFHIPAQSGGFLVELLVPERDSDEWLSGRERCVELAVTAPTPEQEESTLRTTPGKKEDDYALNLRDNCSEILVQQKAEYARRQEMGTLATSIDEELSEALFCQAP